MKVEIKTNEKGYCDFLKIDEKEYGQGIYEVNIKIQAGKPTEILFKAKSDEFILDSENNKLFIEKYQDNKILTAEDIIEYAKKYQEENK